MYYIDRSNKGMHYIIDTSDGVGEWLTTKQMMEAQESVEIITPATHIKSLYEVKLNMIGVELSLSFGKLKCIIVRNTIEYVPIELYKLCNTVSIQSKYSISGNMMLIFDDTVSISSLARVGGVKADISRVRDKEHHYNLLDKLCNSFWADYVHDNFIYNTDYAVDYFGDRYFKDNDCTKIPGKNYLSRFELDESKLLTGKNYGVLREKINDMFKIRSIILKHPTFDELAKSESLVEYINAFYFTNQCVTGTDKGYGFYQVDVEPDLSINIVWKAFIMGYRSDSLYKRFLNVLSKLKIIDV